MEFSASLYFDEESQRRRSEQKDQGDVEDDSLSKPFTQQTQSQTINYIGNLIITSHYDAGKFIVIDLQEGEQLVHRLYTLRPGHQFIWCHNDNLWINSEKGIASLCLSKKLIPVQSSGSRNGINDEWRNGRVTDFRLRNFV